MGNQEATPAAPHIDFTDFQLDMELDMDDRKLIFSGKNCDSLMILHANTVYGSQSAFVILINNVSQCIDLENHVYGYDPPPISSDYESRIPIKINMSESLQSYLKHVSIAVYVRKRNSSLFFSTLGLWTRYPCTIEPTADGVKISLPEKNTHYVR